MNASVRAVFLTLAYACACSTSGSGASPRGGTDGGSTSASSSGSGSTSSSGSPSGGSSGSSSGSGADGSAGSGEDGGTGGDGGGTGSDATAVEGGDSGPAVVRPCDIYQSANTPCVAAHSMVRALYGSYSGRLYQVQRASDNTTQDISTLGPGGYANSSAQDTFCANTQCTIPIIYDQSPQHNDLTPSPPATNLPNGGKAASADSEKITMAGNYPVYGVYQNPGGTSCYRNNTTTGVAKGNEPEAMYMVLDATKFSPGCCYDYGNAESNGKDDGDGTMEAIYWGTDTFWGGQGQGNGPWIAADLENGMFKCDMGFPQTNLNLVTACPGAAQSIIAKFATLMVKGPTDNTFTLKSADAQSGTLVVQWDGPRPSASGYYPKNLQGAIILGTGGDGSNGGEGTFFEGAMTAGDPPDAIDDMVQANIAAAGYGQ